MHDLISDYFSNQKSFIHLIYSDKKILNYNAFMSYQNLIYNNLLELEKEFEINEKVYRIYKIQNMLFRFLAVEKDNQLFELYIII